MMKIRRLFSSLYALQAILLVMMLSFTSAQAEEAYSAVYRQQVDKSVTDIYDKLVSSLEDSRFFVVFEPNIGKSISGFAEKWGEDYNRNKLTEIRSVVFCNGWYANQVSNLDPDMLGFCPLHLTLIEKDRKTTVLFNRPSVVAQKSPAKDLFLKIESEVISAIKAGLD